MSEEKKAKIVLSVVDGLFLLARWLEKFAENVHILSWKVHDVAKYRFGVKL